MRVSQWRSRSAVAPKQNPAAGALNICELVVFLGHGLAGRLGTFLDSFGLKRKVDLGSRAASPKPNAIT